MAGEEQVEGAWVFLSHSHKDLEKVRRIRDSLEAKGHNPLMFFLKCLDDDSELDDLIRREIDARTWFILCQSPNASASRWVQQEVEIIKGLEGKAYEEIDLDDDLESQVERAAALSRRATVFISYSRETEGEVAKVLRAELLKHDFRVFLDVEDLSPGNWAEQIRKAVDESVREGYFLLLLSPERLASEFVRQEVHYAFDRQAASGRSNNIVPIVVRDFKTTLDALRSDTDMWELMGWIYLFDLTAGVLRERIAELITSLKTREME